jgi:ethanolamine utilization protein EutN
MEIGRLFGTVVATRKVPGLDGIKLQLMQPLDSELQPHGEPVVVANALSAGPGELVAWVGGREAALALPEPFVPVDAAVVEVLDAVDSDPRWRDMPIPGAEEVTP